MTPKKGDFFQIRVNGRTLIVEISMVGPEAISGWEVNKGGERVCKETKTTETYHLLIFKQERLRRQMKMNLHYGELEAVR